MNFAFKKNFIFFILLAFSVLSVQASGKRDKLFETVETGTEKEIKTALKKNPDYANIKRGKEKESLLMSALKEDRSLSVINILLKYGADPMQKDAEKRNSIMYAAKYSSSPEVLERLIKDNSLFNFSRRKKILKTDKNGKNAFDYVQENSSPNDMIEVLRKFIKEKTEKSEENEQILEEVQKEQEETQIPQNIKTEETVLENKKEEAKIEEKTENPKLPAPEENAGNKKNEKNDSAEDVALNSIMQNGNEDETLTSAPQKEDETTSTEKMPKFERKIEISPYEKTNLFDYALENDGNEVPQKSSPSILRTFIENPDEKDSEGRTKLMNAAKQGDLNLTEDLIFSKANINAKDNDGWTALMFASRFSENDKVVEKLIKNGADIKAKNNYGVSSLKLASSFSKNSKIVSQLLSGYEISDSEVRSSFITAITEESPSQILDAFFEYGLPVNSFYDGKTPLMYAAEFCKDTKIIQWLLSNGAKISYKTDSGMTAFDFAKKNKKLKRDSIFWSLENF